MTEDATDHADWPLRPWLLAGLLGLAGLLIYFVGGGEGPDTKVGWQAAVSALLFFGAAAFAFTVEHDRWRAPFGFALVVGLVMAGLAWRAVGAGDRIADPGYGFMAGVVATGIALPLFQAGFLRTRWATPYTRIHHDVWSDAICVAGSVAFLGASWLLLFALSELFQLLKIDLLKNLLRADWFGWTFSGAALGAALGTLRNELGIIGTLQRVVMTVLSILAVPLAAGIALFLVAMVLSGPEVLWNATRNATPVLLVCAAGAWVLANAIVRAGDSQMSGNRMLRAAGMVLAFCILPLTVFAAVSMGTRLAQHGLSPERLWGLVAIAVATAYGLAWFVAVVRGWKGGAWRDNLRRANLHLAVVICGIALFLALPILDFGAIATRQQVARLHSGAVSAQEFDYTALRWNFGDAGRRALTRLAESANPDVARRAADAQRLQHRPRAPYFRPPDSPFDLRVQPADPHLEAMVRAYLQGQPELCDVACVALDLGPTDDGRRRVAIVHGAQYDLAVVGEGGGGAVPPRAPAPPFAADSTVEIRTLPRRTIVVDGVPLDPPLPD